ARRNVRCIWCRRSRRTVRRLAIARRSSTWLAGAWGIRSSRCGWPGPRAIPARWSRCAAATRDGVVGLQIGFGPERRSVRGANVAAERLRRVVLQRGDFDDIRHDVREGWAVVIRRRGRMAVAVWVEFHVDERSAKAGRADGFDVERDR